MRTGKARTGLSARLACHRRWTEYGMSLPSHTRGGSRMRESRPYGSVRGACDETHVPTATCASRKLERSSRWKSGLSKGKRAYGSASCVHFGGVGYRAYTAIAWGVGLSHERSDIAGADSFLLARRQHVRHRYARCRRPAGVQGHITCKGIASEAGRSRV